MIYLLAGLNSIRTGHLSQINVRDEHIGKTLSHTYPALSPAMCMCKRQTAPSVISNDGSLTCHHSNVKHRVFDRGGQSREQSRLNDKLCGLVLFWKRSFQVLSVWRHLAVKPPSDKTNDLSPPTPAHSLSSSDILRLTKRHADNKK